MRELAKLSAVILVTALITSLITSYVWLFGYARRDAVLQAEIGVIVEFHEDYIRSQALDRSAYVQQFEAFQQQYSGYPELRLYLRHLHHARPYVESPAE